MARFRDWQGQASQAVRALSEADEPPTLRVAMADANTGEFAYVKMRPASVRDLVKTLVDLLYPNLAGAQVDPPTAVPHNSQDFSADLDPPRFDQP